MANFDQELWEQIGARLLEFIPAQDLDNFAYEHDLKGVRLDRIAKARKGTSVETLVKICEAADINPTYLLFGKGLKRLSAVLKPF